MFYVHFDSNKEFSNVLDHLFSSASTYLNQYYDALRTNSTLNLATRNINYSGLKLEYIKSILQSIFFALHNAVLLCKDFKEEFDAEEILAHNQCFLMELDTFKDIIEKHSASEKAFTKLITKRQFAEISVELEPELKRPIDFFVYLLRGFHDFNLSVIGEGIGGGSAFFQRNIGSVS